MRRVRKEGSRSRNRSHSSVLAALLLGVNHADGVDDRARIIEADVSRAAGHEGLGRFEHTRRRRRCGEPREVVAGACFAHSLRVGFASGSSLDSPDCPFYGNSFSVVPNKCDAKSANRSCQRSSFWPSSQPTPSVTPVRTAGAGGLAAVMVRL